MAKHDNIDVVLRNWSYRPEGIQVRQTKGDDGRDVIQMRVELGILQLEVNGRPDGLRPGGETTYYEYLLGVREFVGEEFQLNEEQCEEVDREFVQYYHRRQCWLRLQNYQRAVEDADHTLNLMNFCIDCSPDEQWTMSHEQYRPFVLFDRTQAAALAELEASHPEEAVEEVDRGLESLRELFVENDAEEHFDDHELIVRLRQLREALTERFDDGARLRKQLADAVAKEQYELAARIRDELAQIDRRR